MLFGVLLDVTQAISQCRLRPRLGPPRSSHLITEKAVLVPPLPEMRMRTKSLIGETTPRMSDKDDESIQAIFHVSQDPSVNGFWERWCTVSLSLAAAHLVNLDCAGVWQASDRDTVTSPGAVSCG